MNERNEPHTALDNPVPGYPGVYETPEATFYGMKPDGSKTATFTHPQGALTALTPPESIV